MKAKPLDEQMRSLESGIEKTLKELEKLELEEMDLEPKHRELFSSLYESDAIANLPNQTMRDMALENTVMNDMRYAEAHREYLMNKLFLKQKYRRYRFLEECLKDRRTELQTRLG